MNCVGAQAILSARMDGEHVARRQSDATEAHVRECPGCRAFEHAAEAVRAAVRIRPAEDVPDLVQPIMASVAAVAVAERFPSRAGGRAGRMIAAALVGAIVGSIVVGGPWQERSNRSIAVAAVAHGIRSAAGSIDAFSATFAINEYGLSPETPERQLEMDLAFAAPQRFRLDVRDLTPYPSRAWTPTDLTYIEDMPSTFRAGPTGCPATLTPDVCKPTRMIVTRASDYSAAAPLPADLILPIATFGSTRGIDAIGRDEIGGRDAVRVEMSFARAAPLFPFLRLGGTWRPFFDGDRVVLWLDAESWFPLKYTVSPSLDPERREWEMRFGRAAESPDSVILEVTATSWREAEPDAALFEIPGATSEADIPLTEVVRKVGYLPATPTAPGTLQLASIVVPKPVARATPRSLLVYADGLDYLRVAERPGWHGSGPFGPVGAAARRVDLKGGGVAYYEPAGDGLGRRLAIHSGTTDLFLETNLTRPRLLAIAASIPVSGLPFPRTWSLEAS
jgi:hypothetical protein